MRIRSDSWTPSGASHMLLLPAANSDAPLPPEHCLRRFLYALPPFKINALRDSQSANPRLIKVNPGHPSTPELSFHCTAQAATSSATCPTNPPRTAPLTRSFAAIDYKAPEIINNYNDLEEYRVSKTLVCFGFSALRGKSPRPIGNARTL